MITIDFVQKAMEAVLSGRYISCYLGSSPTTNVTSLGNVTLSGAVTKSDDGTSYTWQTAKETYFEENTAGTVTVNCINACGLENGSYVPYYSMPLQGSAEIPKGYMIKVNPYVEERNRGIKVTFSIPQTTGGN